MNPCERVKLEKKKRRGEKQIKRNKRAKMRR